MVAVTVVVAVGFGSESESGWSLRTGGTGEEATEAGGGAGGSRRGAGGAGGVEGAEAVGLTRFSVVGWRRTVGGRGGRVGVGVGVGAGGLTLRRVVVGGEVR